MLSTGKIALEKPIFALQWFKLSQHEKNLKKNHFHCTRSSQNLIKHFAAVKWNVMCKHQIECTMLCFNNFCNNNGLRNDSRDGDWNVPSRLNIQSVKLTDEVKWSKVKWWSASPAKWTFWSASRWKKCLRRMINSVQLIIFSRTLDEYFFSRKEYEEQSHL